MKIVMTHFRRTLSAGVAASRSPQLIMINFSKHLSFDEFKYAKGRMAFEYIDAETGDILDILEDVIIEQLEKRPL